VENLRSATREELIEIIRLLAGQVETLQARVEQLEAENLRLRRGGGSQGELCLKPSRPAKEKKPRKQRQQCFVRRKEQADEVVRHTVERCPDCGRSLQGGWEHSRRQVIELVVQRKVVDHVIWARRCGVCGKRWLPKMQSSETQVQGKRRFGASVQGLVASLHIGCRMPVRMIRKVLWELGELWVSNGEIVKLLDGVRASAEPEIAALKERVRGAPAVCADETGWRENGENGYLWGFFTLALPPRTSPGVMS